MAAPLRAAPPGRAAGCRALRSAPHCAALPEPLPARRRRLRPRPAPPRRCPRHGGDGGASAGGVFPAPRHGSARLAETPPGRGAEPPPAGSGWDGGGGGQRHPLAEPDSVPPGPEITAHQRQSLNLHGRKHNRNYHIAFSIFFFTEI